MELANEAKITLIAAKLGDQTALNSTALQALSSANVIVHGPLVSPEILALAPKGAVLVFVGKKLDKSPYTQQDINELLVEYALYYGHVVRLDGGEAYMTENSSIEASYAKSQDVPAVILNAKSTNSNTEFLTN